MPQGKTVSERSRTFDEQVSPDDALVGRFSGHWPVLGDG
jgi:hypothetical protein